MCPSTSRSSWVRRTGKAHHRSRDHPQPGSTGSACSRVIAEDEIKLGARGWLRRPQSELPATAGRAGVDVGGGAEGLDRRRPHRRAGAVTHRRAGPGHRGPASDRDHQLGAGAPVRRHRTCPATARGRAAQGERRERMVAAPEGARREAQAGLRCQRPRGARRRQRGPRLGGARHRRHPRGSRHHQRARGPGECGRVDDLEGRQGRPSTCQSSPRA